ncbi:protein arginine N-methyltransferase 2 [Rhinophrynus dorsalis]
MDPALSGKRENTEHSESTGVQLSEGRNKHMCRVRGEHMDAAICRERKKHTEVPEYVAWKRYKEQSDRDMDPEVSVDKERCMKHSESRGRERDIDTTESRGRDEDPAQSRARESDLESAQSRVRESDLESVQRRARESNLEPAQSRASESELVSAQSRARESDLNSVQSRSRESDLKSDQSRSRESDLNSVQSRSRESDLNSVQSRSRESDLKSVQSRTRESDLESSQSRARESDLESSQSRARESDLEPDKTRARESDLESSKSRARESDLESDKTRARESDLEPDKTRARESDSESSKSRARESDLESSKSRARESVLEPAQPRESVLEQAQNRERKNELEAAQSIEVEKDSAFNNMTVLEACWVEDCMNEEAFDASCAKRRPEEFVMMCDYLATDDTQLTLKKGDRVLLLSVVTPDWWWVEHGGVCGYVPASHFCEAYNEEEDDPWQDEEYFGSYKTLKLHLEMLSDFPRTQTYREVIARNSSALQGKRILDLGCGTGIISFFCAKLAQPEAVYAVEASEIAEQTCSLVDQNGFSGIVHVIRQRAEELELPSKVDVLVSEWMGTCLLFEFMIESVLQARDLWLKEDGVMWPSTASVHLVPCTAAKEYANKVLFWDSPFELDFSLLKPLAVKEFLSKPKPDHVLQPEECLSEPCVLLNLDMKTLQVTDLEQMSSKFTFCVHRDGYMHGFTAWFTVQFNNIEEQGHLELNTGPFSPLTHWKHTLFMMDEPLPVQRGDQISGSAVFHRNAMWRRHMSVTLSWAITNEALDKVRNVGCKVFPIWR